MQLEAVANVELVAHLDAVEEHVGLPAPLRLAEEQPPLPVQDVELLLGGVAELREERAERVGVPAPSEEVDVLVGAAQRRAPRARAQQRDADAAGRPQQHAGPLRLVEDRVRLGDGVGGRRHGRGGDRGRHAASPWATMTCLISVYSSRE